MGAARVGPLMRVTVLGACGAWPSPADACSGFLVEHDGFRLVLDLGYGTMPRLRSPETIDAVLISHGHPDHCADLNPLLRARTLRDSPPKPLRVYAPAGALDAVLALDRPGMLDYDLRGFEPSVGPFRVDTRMLPHWLPNAGIRLTAGGTTLAYTGDTGPSPLIAELARDADLLIAEASYAGEVPEDSRAFLSSARQAGRNASAAGVGRLLLTHLMPGESAATALDATTFPGPVEVARTGMTVDLAAG
ncbi:MBL fold metallo-hydrolase [Actinoplanes subtropicus]|uniref:MBL fold metallo-hydrolase n=1 Tax=Actinoplanes subtropicus TaxID=543632 RepID=UPI001FE03BD7|nr:MBL fold metallo-hydrolase [Actinoplanes subtropicus]